MKAHELITVIGFLLIGMIFIGCGRPELLPSVDTSVPNYTNQPWVWAIPSDAKVDSLPPDAGVPPDLKSIFGDYRAPDTIKDAEWSDCFV